MNPDELRVILSRLTAAGYQAREVPAKEGFILLAKDEPFHRKLLLIGANLYQTDQWRDLIIKTVLAERNQRTQLSLAVLLLADVEGAGGQKVLAYLGEMPWVEAVWEKAGPRLSTFKAHFRWQVEERILSLAVQLANAVVLEQPTVPGSRREETGGRPRLTYILLFINLLVFLATMLHGETNPTSFLIGMGAKYNPRLWMGEYWRLLTPLFLHAGWEHFLFSAFALFQLGSLVERFFGERRFFWIYFGAGLLGTLSGVLCQPDTVAVGVPGAICGLVGALLYFRIRRPQTAQGLFGRSFWIILGLNLVLGLVLPGIDYTGLLGGFLGGLLWAYALGLGKKDQITGRWLWRCLLGLVIVLATIKAMTPPPNKWYLPLETGRLALEQEDYTNALAALEESYRLNPQSALASRLLASAYLAEGEKALAAEEWDKAVQYLEESQKVQPNDRAARPLLARAYLNRSFHRYNAADLAGAEEDCARGIALNLRIEGFHYILGAVYYQQERWADAVQELETVLRLNPENQAAQALLAESKKAGESMK
ncbi:MAG: rhomboid family intramembrane serine protease [Firmicutes bacterium]|nr:rhomboid family intramembrane serine protease [Bacillota bacterium]